MRKPNHVPRLFLDCDGVLADFDRGARDLLGMTPKAYKDIEQVMARQDDLVEIVAELKQVVCVKG